MKAARHRGDARPQAAASSRFSPLARHDAARCLLAHRAAIHEGRIHQDGAPSELLSRPASPFVADFVRESAIVQGTVKDAKTIALDAELDIATGARVSLKTVHVGAPSHSLSE